MATLTLKNVPDEVLVRLKAQAARHRRSMNSEAIRCLEHAVASEWVDEDQLLAELSALRERAGVYVTKLDIRTSIESGRA